MGNPTRAMALEAGSAAHEAYAAARLWQLGRVQGLREHEQFHGVRLFTEHHYEDMCARAATSGDDERLAFLRFCLAAFENSGFYDDPADKRRTVVNIEEALIAYLDRFDLKRNVWVEDTTNPQARVGIEMSLDVTVTYTMHDDSVLKLRFIGTADGLSVERDGALRLEENKTASRLGEAWCMSFHMSHQQTGYLMALSTLIGQPVTKAAVHGMCIPLPRTYDAGGLMTEIVNRNENQFQQFLEWILHLVQVIEIYGNEPWNAPKHTGACNKYFRACSLIPLCAAPREDQQEYYDMMVERQLSPTEEALDGKGDE